MVENLFVKKNSLQDILSSLNTVISNNESTEFITGHVIYNPAYTYKLQLKVWHCWRPIFEGYKYLLATC